MCEPTATEKRYPKVLLVNVEPVSSRYATGITMANLFSGWPKDRIAQIFLDDSEPDLQVCEHSLRLEIQHLKILTPVKDYIARMRSSKDVYTHKSQENDHEVKHRIESKNKPNNRLGSYLKQLSMPLVCQLLEFSSFSLSRNHLRYIDNFKPELIYSVLGNIHLIHLVRDLSYRYHVPVVPHIMDDWVSTHYRTGFLGPFLRRRMLRGLQSLIADAPAALVIGEAMRIEYCRRYHREFIPFMNCVDTKIRHLYRSNENKAKKFIFAYVGGFHLNRGACLLKIANILLELRKEGLWGEIVIYQQRQTAKLPQNLLVPSVMRMATNTEYASINSPDAAIDAFIHVDSFEAHAIEFMRFSLSGKLPWCMAAGVPFFAFGPAELGTIQYIRERQIGTVIDVDNSSKLRESLIEFISDKALRKRYSQNARHIAIKEHEASRQRELFRFTLDKAVSQINISETSSSKLVSSTH